MRFNLPSGIQRMNANLTQSKSVNIARNANGLIKIASIMDVFSVIYKD